MQGPDALGYVSIRLQRQQCPRRIQCVPGGEVAEGTGNLWNFHELPSSMEQPNLIELGEIWATSAEQI